MNRILYLVLCFATTASTSPAFADDSDYGCKGKDTNSFFDTCVNLKQAEELEKEINQSLKMVAALAPSKQDAKNLIDSQVAWKKYRDKACQVQQQLMGGMNSSGFARCVNTLTRERLDYLKSSY
ncbi:MAG: lysozyme inhibitor LprI family protein [Pseudomonadota bacterium]